MLRAIARFELRLQLRGHVFWTVFAISTAMVLGSVGIDALRVGSDIAGLRNGAAAVVQTHLVWTLFFMFTTAAFVADAVVRDELVGFAPIIRAAPVRWRDLVYGRFVGAFAAVVLCFVSVPLGMLAGAAMPWVDPATVGPVRPSAYAFAFLALALPNVLLSASLGFALATRARSLGAALAGAVALVMLYGLGAHSGAGLPPLVEPFGFAAYAEATGHWSIAQRNAAVPVMNGVLLANRLLWLGVSVALLAFAAKRRDTPAKQKAEPTGLAKASRSVRLLPVPASVSPFRARLALETGQIVRTPVFLALLLLGTANAITALWPVRGTGDARLVVRTVAQALQLAPIVAALFFAGELRWKEQESRIAPLIATMPLPRTAFLLPKFAALALVLVAMTGATAIAAACVAGTAAGPTAIALLPAWFATACYNAVLFAALAMFLQAIAPNKMAGWGFTVLFLVANLALDRLGLREPLYRFARYPGWPLPSAVSKEATAWLYQLYWAVLAALLLAAATAIAQPGGRRV